MTTPGARVDTSANQVNATRDLVGGRTTAVSADSITPLLPSGGDVLTPDLFHVLTRFNYYGLEKDINEFEEHRIKSRNSSVEADFLERIRDCPRPLVSFVVKLKNLPRYDFDMGRYRVSLDAEQTVPIKGFARLAEMEFRERFDPVDVAYRGVSLATKGLQAIQIDIPMAVEEAEALREAAERGEVEVQLACRLHLETAPVSMTYSPKVRSGMFLNMERLIGKALANERMLQSQAEIRQAMQHGGGLGGAVYGGLAARYAVSSVVAVRADYLGCVVANTETGERYVSEKCTLKVGELGPSCWRP